MAREGNFHIENHTARDKITYESIMKAEVDEINIDGRTFTYKTTESDTDYHAVQDDAGVDLEFSVKINSSTANTRDSNGN